MTNKLLLLTASLLLFCSCSSQGGSTSSKREDTPFKGKIIELNDKSLSKGQTDTIRFGRMQQGEQAVMKFRLRNATKAPLVLLSYDRSCGCNELTFHRKPLSCGEEMECSLTFNTQGFKGWQLKLLELNFAGHSKPLHLLVEAQIH